MAATQQSVFLWRDAMIKQLGEPIWISPLCPSPCVLGNQLNYELWVSLNNRLWGQFKDQLKDQLSDQYD
jgi:hypothetical protein